MPPFWKIIATNSLYLNWVGLFGGFTEITDVKHVLVSFKNGQVLPFKNTEALPVGEQDYINEPIKK